MAEPIFKTIDYSNQIANNNKAASDSMVKGIQNISNTFLAGRQQSIDQARQLMADYDAVINEVDDMHKENVSKEIEDTQKKLANNIYKAKGKNGVKLRLGNISSNDFNYAREMRGLKNLAANSRMSRENLDRARTYAKTHKYFENSQQRTEYLAAVADFYSSSKTLKASPTAMQEGEMAIKLDHTDIASEAKDIILDDMTKNRESLFSIEEDGAEYRTTVISYGDLFKDGNYDEAEIEKHAQLYIDKTGIAQTNLEGIKDKLRSSAAASIQERSRTSEKLKFDQANAERLRKANEQSDKGEKIAKEKNEKITDLASIIAKGQGEEELQLLTLTAGIKKAKYLDSAEEFIKHMVFRDRDSPPSDKKGTPLWETGEAVTYEELVEDKFGDLGSLDLPDDYDDDDDLVKKYKKYRKVKEHYVKIWNEGVGKGDSNQRMILFDYEGNGRSYNLADATNAEQIEQVIRSLTATAQKGIDNTPYQGKIPFDDGMSPFETDIPDEDISNSTGAIEDQVNPTVKKGILDPPD